MPTISASLAPPPGRRDAEGLSPIQSAPGGLQSALRGIQGHSPGNGPEQGFLVPWGHIDVATELIQAPVPRKAPDRLQRCPVLGCRGGKAPPERVEAAP
jgi:hypothetical protein